MSPSSLIRQAVLSTVGVAVQGLARFGYSVLIARFVGAEQLALVNTLISLSIILSLLWPTAAGNAAGAFLVRALRRGHAPQHLLARLWRSTAIALVPICLLGVVVVLTAVDATAADALALAALVVAWSAYILTRGIRMGLGQVGAAALWDVVTAFGTLALLGAVLATGADALLLWPLILGYLAFAVAAIPAMRRTASGGTSDTTTQWSEVIHLIGWNSAGLLATNGLIQFSMVFAYATSTPREAGMFAAAIALATPASMLAQAVSQVLIPRFSHWLDDDLRAARRHYLGVMAAMGGVLMVAFGAVAFLAPWLVPFLYGPGYDGAVPLLQLLLAGSFLFSVGLLASSFLITSWRTVAATWASVAGSLAGIAVMAVSTGALGGAVAASVGVLAGTSVTAVAAVAISLRTPVRPAGRPAPASEPAVPNG